MLARELDLLSTRELRRRAGTRDLPSFPADAKGIATREASGKVLNAIAAKVPWLIGGVGRLVALDQDQPRH